MTPLALTVIFNFRSPYCYLAARRTFALVEQTGVALDWRPLGGWDGRTPADRVGARLKVVRQDVKRWATRLGLPFVPPPTGADGSAAAAVSLLAQERGRLEPFCIAALNAVWGEGLDIGDVDLLVAIAARVGLAAAECREAAIDGQRRAVLRDNAESAARLGLFGVPSYAIGDEVFWGQDRLEFVRETIVRLQGGEGHAP